MRKEEKIMRVVNPIGKNVVDFNSEVNYTDLLRAGCICSGSSAVSNKEAKYDGDPCNCYCAGDDKNRQANDTKAYVH